MRSCVVAVAFGALACWPAHADGATAPSWIAAWGAPMTGAETGGPANATVRNIARVTLGGSRVRIRLSNPLSQQAPLRVGAAYIGLQKDATGAALVPGSNRQLTFDGKPDVTIPPKSDFVTSDPIDFPLIAQQNVAVSLFLPAAENPAPSGAAFNTSYRTADDGGDKTRDEAADAFATTLSGPFALAAIDVLTDQADGAVVGLGSSTFHGSNSTRDAYDRVTDLISVKINKGIPHGRQKGIVGAGIGGDNLKASLANRLARDVFGQTAVAGVIVYNVNDMTAVGGLQTAAQIIESYRTLIAQAHQRAVRVFCPTWPPAAHGANNLVGNERRKLNTWILESGECDDVVDWDAVLRGAAVEDAYDPQYLSDGIHPNPAGHRALADSTPLRWFSTAPATTTTFASDLGLPARRKCISRRHFRIRILSPRGQRLVSARVYLNGRRIKTSGRGRQLTAVVDLRGLPRGRAEVRIVARTRSGRTYVRTRGYRTCAARFKPVSPK